jgi:hypothetical protein
MCGAGTEEDRGGRDEDVCDRGGVSMLTRGGDGDQEIPRGRGGLIHRWSNVATVADDDSRSHPVDNDIWYEDLHELAATSH